MKDAEYWKAVAAAFPDALGKQAAKGLSDSEFRIRCAVCSRAYRRLEPLSAAGYARQAGGMGEDRAETYLYRIPGIQVRKLTHPYNPWMKARVFFLPTPKADA